MKINAIIVVGSILMLLAGCTKERFNKATDED
jgi:hypothetical protein